MALRLVAGAEHGSTAGWATGNTTNRIIDTITGSPTVTSSTPRTGSYCYEVSASAATEAIAWSTNTLGSSQNRGRCVLAVRWATLPAASVIIAQWTSPTAQNGELRFNASTTKLAAAIEGGTIQDGPTVTTGVWYVVELYYQINATTQTLDWWVDGVAQTQATGTGTANFIGTFELGCSSVAQTHTTRYDDIVIYTDTAAISGPLGAHKVEILTIDPAGTFTLSGFSAANLQTFTANGGTRVAWNATTARNNVDERPPTIGSTADGWCIITDVPTNTWYVQMPMTSYTLGAGEVVTGARMLACGWAASTTSANFGLRSWNGTTERTLFATGDPNFDASTTNPAWVCKMLTTADVDTQAELDALEFRAGFSSDASPDIGLHAIYCELGIQTPVLINANAECATATATAHDATVQTETSGTQASAEAATASGAAETASVATQVVATAEAAEASVAAGDITAAIAPIPEVAAASTSVAASTDIQSPAEAATASASAPDAGPSVGVDAGASATASALDATISTAATGTANAEAATASASAGDITAGVSASAEAAEAALAVIDAAIAIVVNAEAAIAAGAAEASGSTGVSAELATATAAAHDITAQVAPTAELATATATAHDGAPITIIVIGRGVPITTTTVGGYHTSTSAKPRITTSSGKGYL